MPATAPRTLADQLRGWSDEQLSALLEARPDLATPAPHDSSQLAARVVVKASVLRALDGLDALELAVLQALVQDTDPTLLGARPTRSTGPSSGCARWRWCGAPPTARSSSSRDLLRLPPGPPADEVPALLERARRARAGDPRPPRRDRRRRPLERGGRARPPTWSLSGCWRTSTSAT